MTHMKKPTLLYLQIADSIEHQIRSEVLKAGDKLPSLRSICIEKGVSLNTAQQAYLELEKKGLIASRPQSGYYVAFTYKKVLQPPSSSSPSPVHGIEDIEKVISTVNANRRKTRGVLFSYGMPAVELLPVAKLNKAMQQAIRHLPDSGVSYDSAGGNELLKNQIAKRAHTWGGKLREQDIVTSAGSIGGISTCMLSLLNTGDTIAVESPIYYGILQLAKSMGLKVIELPTNAITGVDPDALEKVMRTKKIKLCLLVSNFSNPLGSCMPDEHKRAVAALMAKYDTPLIEDDIYGDLYLGHQRPTTCKTYDESGNVLLCSSFSKTLAPGYRVGWIVPGKYKYKVERTKVYHSLSNNSLAQQAIAHFLENERYDNHLQKLRQTLKTNQLHYLRCISEYFPEGTKVSRPEGGFILWIELHKKKNTLELYDRLIQQNISIAPGAMYTLQKQFQNCFRASYGLVWNEKVEQALKTVGKLSKNFS
jgi:DNA-binding transcriptional MocR family regulator